MLSSLSLEHKKLTLPLLRNLRKQSGDYSVWVTSLLSQTYSREKVVHAAASCAWVYISKRHMLLSLSNSIICCIPVVNWSNILIELPFGCRCSFYHRLKVHHDYEKEWESKVTQDIIIMNQWPHIDGIKAGPLHLQHSDSVWPGEMVNWEKESCATCRRKQEKQGPVQSAK